MPRDFDDEPDAFDEENYEELDSDGSFLSELEDDFEDDEMHEEEAEDIEQLYEHMIRSEAVINLLIKKGILTHDEVEKERNRVEQNLK